jgi:hypothetical protein
VTARDFVQRRETTGPDLRKHSNPDEAPDRFDDDQFIRGAISVQWLNDSTSGLLHRSDQPEGDRGPPICLAR